MTALRVSALAACGALVWMSFACSRGDRVTPAEEAARRTASGPAGPAAASPITTPDTTRRSTLEPGALRSVAAAPVTLWKGAGDQAFEVTLRTADPANSLSRRFGSITLRTSLRARSADLGQYPCTSCHLGRGIVLREERVGDAHENIQAVHPEQTGGACSTCHAADNVELLALRSGERATLDHTYRVCAQCHFSQAESWAGGAHGKRLDGWQGRRVLMGCADCHDPHKPKLEPRIPFRAPQIERTRGNNR